MNAVRPYSESVVSLTPDSGIFSEINNLLIALQSLAVALHLHSGHSPHFGSRDYVTVEGKYLDVGIRLPLHGPVQAAMKNHLPDLIELTVVEGDRGTGDHSSWHSRLQNYLNHLFPPLLLYYHERHRDWMWQRHHSDRTKLPDAWQMGWAIRNATAHNGRVFDPRKSSGSVQWRGLIFSRQDEPAQGLLDYVNGGDLLILMFDMEKSLQDLLAG
ncbi:hypothetical protein MASR1M60_09980 [Rhodocyclaceae bacterium]